MSKTTTPHDSAWGHVTGESVFLDDRPPLRGEVHVDVVGSPVAYGQIKQVHLDEAKEIPGVVGLFTAQDLAHNIWGTIIQDQPILAHDTVLFVGEPVVVIAAETREALRAAKKAVKIEVEVFDPTLSITKAREEQNFIAVKRIIERGQPREKLSQCAHVLKGQFFNKGQDHFYLESHAAIVYPGERGQLEVHSSSQHPTEVQHLVAEALGLKQHQVVCIVKRMGGGFGGKESQAAPYAVFPALVAQKLNRPARLILSKDDDMMYTGKRHPFQTDYEIGFDENGQIQAAVIELFSDGGAYADLSTSVLERAMLHADNAYYLPEVFISGQICRTHTPPNTAFRGFGGPQGVAVIEHILEDIAIYLNEDSYTIRRRNVYEAPDRLLTPYGQTVENNVLPLLFDQLYAEAEYPNRRKEIDDFNQKSRTQLRGMAMTAVKFGISFTTRFLNQGNALINIHRDGTIQVSTGATEMGQGVNTKIRQIVAECFEIDTEHVIVMATSTEKNANTSPTAASSGTDINGAAALLAAEKIKERLTACMAYHFERPERDAMEEIELSQVPRSAKEAVVFEAGEIYNKHNPEQRMSFGDAVNLAYLNRVSLSSYGHYKTPGIGFNKEEGQGIPFYYFTNGVALSEVLIDRFTGELKVLRSDILMDLGRPINEMIDYGQVSGAFIQGVGWVTTENLVYNDKGELLSHSPTTYKIPNVQDTPRAFNLKLIQNQEHKNVRGSKAVGEPPLLLGLSVWAAAKNALSYCSKGLPQLSIPATAESILMELTRYQLPEQNPATEELPV